MIEHWRSGVRHQDALVSSARFSLLAPERGKSNHDAIAAVLGVELLRGLYPAGSFMPSEATLIQRFSISRTVLREVIKTLSAKGFVEPKRHVGTLVRNPANWSFFDADVLAWRLQLGLDEGFISTLNEVRRALEPVAAALAARRRRNADLALLRECARKLRNGGHTRQSFAAADLDFHLAVFSASGNPIICSIGSVVETVLTASLAYSSPVDDPTDHDISANGHAAVVEAIEAKDERRAAEGILNVIDLGVQRIDMAQKRRRAE